MLTMTVEAATEIRHLFDQPDLPDTGGLRIARDPSGTLTLGVAVVPAEDDSVLAQGGARVFLDPLAAKVLDDKTLDATTDSEGRVEFMIATQNG